MKLRKHSLLIVTIALVMAIVSGCGGSSEGASQAANASSGNKKEAAAGKQEPVKVIWWHSMGGELGKAADKLVADFNAANKDVQVEAVYQGTYDESLNKMKASMGSNSGPSLSGHEKYRCIKSLPIA